jgi:hypothetical protein
MIIYTKSHLKEVCLHFTPKLQEIFARNFSAPNVRELVASLTSCNSYAHLCDLLKRHPVSIEHNERNNKPFELLSAKHKLSATDEQKRSLLYLCYSQPLALLYTPKCDFPVSEYSNSYMPQSQSPITQLKENAIEFVNLSKPQESPKNEYPEMYLDYDCDIDEAISEYIYENIDFGFSWEDAEKKGLSEDECDALYNKCVEKWHVDNKDKLDDMKVYALQNTASDRYSSLLSEGGIVENYAFKLAELNGSEALKTKLFEHFSKDCAIVYWRTIQPDTEFLSEGRHLQGAFVGTQILYLGILDDAKFTPIGSASALTLNFQYSDENSLFHICDAHSACMNDVYKEIQKHITEQGSSWSEFIDEKSENYESCITRLWSKKNIFDDDHVDAFMAQLFVTSISPMKDEFIDDFEFIEATGAPEIHESCVVFTEVCGASPTGDFVNIMNSYNFEELSEEDRPTMSDEESLAQQKQLQFADCLEKAFKDTTVEVVSYDPWSHPVS